jgi:chemotaxis methyl-accepting protein methylase
MREIIIGTGPPGIEGKGGREIPSLEDTLKVLKQMRDDTAIDFTRYALGTFNAYPFREDDLTLARSGNYEQLLKKLTSHVTQFFRRPFKGWTYLHKSVLPEVLEQDDARIWSAACATGAETYSLAILVHDILGGREHPSLELNGTDIHEEHLQWARQREYGSVLEYVRTDFKERSKLREAIEKSIRDYEQVGVEMLPEVRSRPTFKKHCLHHDEYPTDVDLIVCRNFLKYWNNETREEIANKFYESLRKGGVLWIDPHDLKMIPPIVALQRFSQINSYRMFKKQ